jgi:hypothetical protein
MAVPQELRLHWLTEPPSRAKELTGHDVRPSGGPFTDAPLMTLRVSRDSGKTWGPARAVFGGDDPVPPITSEWPPCRCSCCTTCPEVAKMFGTLTDHCLVCPVCKAMPDRMCPEAQHLYRAWKVVWKESVRSDVRGV